MSACGRFITAQFRGDLVRLTATLSEMIDYDLDMPVIVKVDNITRMSFAEIPKFTVDIKSFSASSSGEYSGDSFEVFDSSVNESISSFQTAWEQEKEQDWIHCFP